MPSWSQLRGFAIPSLCLIPCCLVQVKQAEGQGNNDHPIVEHSAMVYYLVLLDVVKDFSQLLPQIDYLVRLSMAPKFKI